MILGLAVFAIGMPIFLLSHRSSRNEVFVAEGQRLPDGEGEVLRHPSSSRAGVGRTRHSRRPDEVSLADALGPDSIIEADVKGRRLAEGNVKVTMAGGMTMLADRVRISSDGRVVAEGNVSLSRGGGDRSSVVKSDSMTWHFSSDRKPRGIDAKGKETSGD